MDYSGLTDLVASAKVSSHVPEDVRMALRQKCLQSQKACLALFDILESETSTFGDVERVMGEATKPFNEISTAMTFHTSNALISGELMR